MHKLEIKLKQHTPLIHFQHNQEGATLRASEVKPKLDRFILTRLGKGDYKAGVEQAKAKGWLVGKGEHPALDYKMRIIDKQDNILIMNTNEKKLYYDFHRRKDVSKNKEIRYVQNGQIIDGRQQGNIRYVISCGGKNYFGKLRRSDSKIVYDLNNYPCFFANMDADITNSNEYIKITFAENPFSLSLVIKNDGLFAYINNAELISTFFLNHNFGTRQSKGFGSFYPEGASIQNISDYAYFEWNFNNLQLGSWESFYNLFFAIEMFYKTLRSGINQQGVYFKSLMYHYAKDQKSYWDKRTIRYKFRHFNPNKDNDRGETRDNNTDGNNKEQIARLYRDMLGLSSAQQWGSYNDEITKEHVADEDEKKIERFKSPLVFKPIIKGGKAIVYIFPTDIPEQYKGAEFQISSSQRRENFIMKAPESFDIIDFLCYITDDGIKKWIIDQLENMDTNSPIVKTLLVIYNNIKFVES